MNLVLYHCFIIGIQSAVKHLLLINDSEQNGTLLDSGTDASASSCMLQPCKNYVIVSQQLNWFSVQWMGHSKSPINIETDIYHVEKVIDNGVQISFHVDCVGQVDKRDFNISISHGKLASDSVQINGTKYCVYSPLFTYLITIALSAIAILISILAISIFIIYRQRSTGSGNFLTVQTSRSDECIKRTKGGVPIYSRDTFSLLRTTQEGTFGVCYQAEFFTQGERIQTLIKTISKVDDYKNLLTEHNFYTDAQLLFDKSNPRITSLIGYVIDNQGPPLAVFPWKEGGNLKMFLKRCQLRTPTTRPSAKSIVTTDELVSLSVQAAEALTYLSSIHIIHGDIATRNCQLDEHLDLYLCDKLLSRDLFPADYENGHPVRWTAPESLDFPTHTSLKADMWSFGVLIWELMSLARAPYSDIESVDVEKYLADGYRLVKPPGCPDDLYNLIARNCWQYNPDKRPDSRFILHSFHKIRQNPID